MYIGIYVSMYVCVGGGTGSESGSVCEYIFLANTILGFYINEQYACE